MYLISAQGYTNANVNILKIRKTGEIWVTMKDIGDGLGVTNIPDLVLKEIYGIYEKRKLTKEDELNTKSSEFVYVKNNVMTNIIKHCRGEKKRAIDGFTKKLMIPDLEISKCQELEVKSKIGTIFVNEKILEGYSVKIYEIDSCFYEHYKEKIQPDKNDFKYILFRIDIYFTEYFLAIEIDEKGHTDRDLIFEEKRQKALEKKLNCKFIKINTSKENYDADYEASRIQTFISKFKDKENESKIKALEDEIKKLKFQLTNQDV